MAVSGAQRAGRAYVELFADDSRLQAGLKSAQKRLAAFGKSVRSMGISIASFGITMVGAFVPAIMAASKAEETLNKFNAVFGSESGAAESFVQELSTAIGRSATEVRDAMASFQAFFVGLGAGKGVARQMSQTLEGLAIDFASFYNISDEEAVQRFISALSGSVEVLDKFGVNLRVANLDPMLKKMFGTSYQDATELQKAMARLQIIMNAMRDQGAIGDASKTAGSFANQLKRLRSNAISLAESIGKAVLPIVGKWLKNFNEIFGPVVKWIAANGELVGTIFRIGVAIAGIGAVFIAFGSAILGVSATLGVISLVLAKISATVAFMVSPLGAISLALAALAAWAIRSGAAMQWLSTIFKPLWERAVEVFDLIKTALASGDWQAAANVLWAQLYLSWVSGTDAIWGVWQTFTTAAADMFLQMSGMLRLAWSKTVLFLQLAWTGFMTAFQVATLRAVKMASIAFIDLQVLMGKMSADHAKWAKIGIGTAFDVQEKSIIGNGVADAALRMKEAAEEMVRIQKEIDDARKENGEIDTERRKDAEKRLDDARRRYEESKKQIGPTDGQLNIPSAPFGNLADLMAGIGGAIPDMKRMFSGTFSQEAGRMYFSQNPVVRAIDRMVDEQRNTTAAIGDIGMVQ